MKHKIPEGQYVETQYGFAFNGVLEVERVASDTSRGRPWACLFIRCADGTKIEIQASKRKHWIREVKP